MSQENAGAHNSKDCGDRFQHRTHPATQRLPANSNRVAQSKGFWPRVRLRPVLMISGNTAVGCLVLPKAGVVFEWSRVALEGLRSIRRRFVKPGLAQRTKGSDSRKGHPTMIASEAVAWRE
jgi:hypothetical protein